MAEIEHHSYAPTSTMHWIVRTCLHQAKERFAPHGQSPRHYWKPELHQGAGGNRRLIEEPLAQRNFDSMKSKYDSRPGKSLGHSPESESIAEAWFVLNTINSAAK